MSFSDFGRHTTGLSSNGRGQQRAVNIPSESPPRKSMQLRRRSDGDVIRRNNIPAPSNPRRKSTSNAIDDWKAVDQRGVRPQLDHLRCPVTEKTLLESNENGDEEHSQHYSVHDSSLASTSVSTATESHDDESLLETGEDRSHRKTNRFPKHYAPKPKTTRKQPPKLSTEIAQFQKMVSELSSKADMVSSSPEAMWKTRILLRSAQAAREDLTRALESLDQSKASISKVEASAKKKMVRDFQRASEQLRVVVRTMEQTQRAEMSLLTQDVGTITRNDHKTALQLEDDFFEAAMKERQHEVEKISDRMKKVQEIYSELAGLVDDQQDQIDKLEDLNEDVKEDTRAGLEEIQHGMWKLCATHTTTTNHKQPRLDLSDSTDNPRDVPVLYATSAEQSRVAKSVPLDPKTLLTCMMCEGLNEDTATKLPQTISFDTYLSETLTRRDDDDKKEPQHRSSKATDWTSNFPTTVQESAQDAYLLGQSMIEGIVEQVQIMASPKAAKQIRNQFLVCSSHLSDQNETMMNPDHEGGYQKITTSNVKIEENPLGKDYFDIEEGPMATNTSHHKRVPQNSRRRSGSNISLRKHRRSNKMPSRR